MSFDKQPPRRRYADETRVGGAYENQSEPSEFGLPEHVNPLQYRGTTPRYRRRA